MQKIGFIFQGIGRLKFQICLPKNCLNTYQNLKLLATSPGVCRQDLLAGHVGEDDRAVTCKDAEVSHGVPHELAVLFAKCAIPR